MRTMIRRWGNSAAVRIPSSVLLAAGLTVDSPVDIREEGGRIVVVALSDLREHAARAVNGSQTTQHQAAVEFTPIQAPEKR